MDLKPNLKFFLIAIFVFIIFFAVYSYLNFEKEQKNNLNNQMKKESKISLPKDFVEGSLSAFDSIKTRRSVRDYSKQPLSLKELSTLLFTTQGITSDYKRAAPSAGALYPMETYLVVNNVAGLEKGLYHYLVQEHALEVVKIGDFAQEVRKKGLNQAPLENAAVDFIWTAVSERTTKKYGERGIRYIFIEVGHVSENLYLQANSMDIGVVAIGAFDDQAINKFLGVDSEKETVIYINAVGKK